MSLGVAGVWGRSMAPTLRDGDRVIYERAPQRLRSGDIVVLASTVHRLTWIDPAGGLWECGDAPWSLARRCKRAQVQGRVLAVVRAGAFATPAPAPAHHGMLRVARCFVTRLVWRVRRAVRRAR